MSSPLAHFFVRQSFMGIAICSGGPPWRAAICFSRFQDQGKVGSEKSKSEGERAKWDNPRIASAMDGQLAVPVAYKRRWARALYELWGSAL